MRVGSLFSGVGGWDVGLREAGAITQWFCEIAPYPREVLERRFDAPVLLDIRDLDGATPAVDVLCGGFPCQDLSAAGRGAGIFGPRSGLWFEYARLIGALRPSWVFIENVPPLLRRGMGWLLAGLRELGYDAEWDGIPAAAVGAPHLRDRIWIVAYPASDREAPARVFGEPLGLLPVAHLDHVGDDARWPRAGLMRFGDVWELEPCAPLSAVRGRNSLPLNAAVRLPTPKATDADRGGRGDLIQVVRGNASPSGHFKTPTAAPASGGGGGGELHAQVTRRRPPQAGEDGGALNPRWVEWLMGFPLGWTDLDCDQPQDQGWDDGEPLPRTAKGIPERNARLAALGNALLPQIAYLVAAKALATDTSPMR